MGTAITALSPEARDLLIRHNWPGNVRELENTLVRAAVLAAGPTLMPRDLALATQEPTPPMYGDMSLEEIVRYTDAAIYLLDEWDANLDSSNRAMADALVEQLAQRARVVEISHRDRG